MAQGSRVNCHVSHFQVSRNTRKPKNEHRDYGNDFGANKLSG